MNFFHPKVSSFIGAILCICVFSAHASEPLTLWHKEESTQSRRTLEELCIIFSQEHSVEIEITRVIPTDLAPLLLKNSLENALPDMALVPADLVGLHEQLKLSPLPNNLGTKSIRPSFIKTVTVDNQRYGAPVLGGNHLMLYYNKRFVDKAPTSWEELFSQRESLSQRGVKTIGMHYMEPFWLIGFINAYGGIYESQENQIFNSSAISKALTFYRTIGDEELIDIHCDYSCAARRFYNGEYAYAINGDWAYSDAESALGQDFGVAVIPTIDGTTVRPTFSTTSLVFPDNSLSKDKQDILVKFVEFMQSEVVQEHWYKSADRFPVHESVFEQFKATADKNRVSALQQLENATMMPNEAGMAVVWQGLRKGLVRYLSGSTDVANVTNIMQKYIEHQNKKTRSQ